MGLPLAKIYKFLDKYTPSPHNPICTCGGQFKCLACEATELLEEIVNGEPLPS